MPQPAIGNRRVSGVSRRSLLKASAAATAGLAAAAAIQHVAHAAGSYSLKVGLIGCGGRGSGAAGQCQQGASGIEMWAVGDVWTEKAQAAGQRFKVPPDRAFGGLDAYQKVIASGIDIAILATPPGFRPIHFEAAIRAGKHVFMEKPVCVDPVGYRKVVAAAELAAQKKLCVAAGTQRRHTASYQECIKRIRGGQMGDIVAAQCYWIGSPVKPPGTQAPGQPDVDYQIHNWYNWSWTCGDHIVEQHVHNIDVILWAIGALPEKAIAVGGRQTRQGKGNIYDHFAVEFGFPGGVRVASYCSQFPGGVAHRVGERVVGAKGDSSCNGSINGEKPWKFDGQNPSGQVQEHADLVAAIRGQAPYLNEGKQVADSSMAAVLGRMAAYTGREISWKWAAETSKLDLLPPKMDLAAAFEPHPVAVPGKFELI
ncbi:MAG: Gfo/Idh/MocA family oxidoreductase [Planctomycetes bacterium]|nr:Gfo/Idh/MocA family oxidoreductase [Planctomycetota bacterium]